MAIKFVVWDEFYIKYIPKNVTELEWNIDYPIDAIKDLKQLKVLIFGDNFKKNIDAIKELHQLERLVLGEKFKKSINAIEGLYNLEHLVLGDKFSNNIDVLKKLPKLEYLMLGWIFDRDDGVRVLNDLKHVKVLGVGEKILYYKSLNIISELLSRLDMVILKCFPDKPFKYPNNNLTIRIYNRHLYKSNKPGKYDNFITTLYKHYSEYIMEMGIIKKGLNFIKIWPGEYGYLYVELSNEREKVKYRVDKTTINNIDDFMRRDINIKGARSS